MAAVNADQARWDQGPDRGGAGLAVQQGDFSKHGASGEHGDTRGFAAATGEHFYAAFFNDISGVTEVTPTKYQFVGVEALSVKCVRHKNLAIARMAGCGPL